MSVQSEIDRIITAVGNAYSKVSQKGGTVPASQTVSNLATAIDSIPSSASKETWVIKSNAAGEFATTQIAFTSNGQKFTSIGANDSSGFATILYYDNNEIAGYDPSVGVYEFSLEAYRKLTFDTPPTGALLTWLQANAVKQPDGTAVQDTKAVTITSNGTVSVTPDAPYDGLSSVDVTVNVASGGGTNVITLEYTPVDKNLTISHDVLVGAGIDTEDKFFKIIGISIFPKNGDADWFYVSYGGTLDKTSFMQNLIHYYTIGNSRSVFNFVNMPTYGLPYSISLNSSDNYTADAVNKTLIVTLLLSE